MRNNYVWTEGYKAVNKDMTAIYGEFKYEIGTEYEFAGNPVIYNSGFHFYRDLDDVIRSFPPHLFKYRYFKVKAFYNTKNIQLNLQFLEANVLLRKSFC